MRHTRDEVIERAVREFAALDRVVAGLTDSDWRRPLPRRETKDPWTVKDALVHISYWKADVARSARKERRPADGPGLSTSGRPDNHYIFERWRDFAAAEVLLWHRQVQEEVLAALRSAPDSYFSGRERSPQWPVDIDSHSAGHRTRDIEAALGSGNG